MAIEDVIRTMLHELREIVKTETVVGEPLVVGDVTIVPVSKISFGFGAGGGQGEKDDGGSGTGGGGSVQPVAFIVIAQIARETKINTCVGYNYRYAPMVQHAHNLMQSGQLGDLTHYRGRFFFSRHRYGPLYRRSHQTG